MAFPTHDEIEQCVSPTVSSYGMDVEYVRVHRAGKKSVVAIAVGADTAPGSDDLEALSRELSQLLDDKEEAGEMNFGPGYTLEVTTPGVDFPLTLPRHWRRHRYRAVRIEEEGTTSTWRIGDLKEEDGQARVVLVSREKKPSIRVMEVAPSRPGVVEIEFAHIPEAERELCALSFDDAEERQGHDK